MQWKRKVRRSWKSTNRKGYLNSSIQTGDASLARDNGFNSSVDVKPVKTIDLEFRLTVVACR